VRTTLVGGVAFVVGVSIGMVPGSDPGSDASPRGLTDAQVSQRAEDLAEDRVAEARQAEDEAVDALADAEARAQGELDAVREEAAEAQRRAVQAAVAKTRKRMRAQAQQSSAAGGVGGNLDPRFDTCTAAIDSGYGPYVSGVDAEYSWYDDRDLDGVVCER
jgi:hypothetical protein